MRKAFKVLLLSGLIVGVSGGLFVIAACARPTSDRSGRMLLMAAEEAGFITNTHDRLTRQLNIADVQNRTNRKTDAAKTLDLARETLRTKEALAQLTEVQRLSGWTSICELARTADDKTLAGKALDEALEVLYSMKPEASRAQYVLSLSEVVTDLRGKGEAARLLVKGGEWAGKIEDIGMRRFALTTFSQKLLADEQYEDARTVLRHEADAAWRADTLTGLAQMTFAADTRAMYAAKSAAAPMLDSQAREFNRDVRFQMNYRKDALQQQMNVPAQQQ